VERSTKHSKGYTDADQLPDGSIQGFGVESASRKFLIGRLVDFVACLERIRRFGSGDNVFRNFVFKQSRFSSFLGHF
jgi:hypothetical protein